uniref:Uncharacterized protein n=1 Tax=Chromera velia CCMP2878 TaxID=1169474 RepID=A0A0G4GDE0_9ALVE|eukprot:Cvel_642.t1-p1 / transcript=Cvel_642.t1 / gene=Cvel_642 / organism=Chromera_velia_CCMP2878 / gene_product=Putative ankyrin repeat protein L93, putative / transcript_product=Putative ankyrin repeat protein L93, putative / location=Cvel_scaffold19:186675-188105(-) / protein_length=477 / sequence_SO=supercontig / SO=protein_coding / is_pseudo=false
MLERVVEKIRGGDGVSSVVVPSHAASRETAGGSGGTEKGPGPPPKAVSALKELGEFGGTLRGKVHPLLDQILSEYYRMDLSAVFRTPVRSVIRSFRPVGIDLLSEAYRRFEEKGGYENFARLLYVGAKVDCRTTDGPLLVRAIRERRFEAARLLVSAGANVNIVQGGKNALAFAISKNNLEAVKLLVEAGANLEKKCENMTALTRAVDEQRAKTAKYLVSAGADLSAEDASGQRPLDYAAFWGLSDLLELFLSKGADMNAECSGAAGQIWVKGFRAVHHAAVGGHRKAMEVLLDHGADPNTADSRGRTPLFCTVIPSRGTNSDNVAVAECLLSRGADANVRDRQGCSVLHLAAYYGAVRVLRLLMERGTDINARDREGNSVLHKVCRGAVDFRDDPARVDIARLLIQRGTGLTLARNEGGETAVAFAENMLPRSSQFRIFLSKIVLQPPPENFGQFGEGEGEEGSDSDFLSVIDWDE